MKDTRAEERPAGVPREGTKQVGEVRARWAWTELVVWTERMLTTLEKGVKGGMWFSLIDKVYDARTLRAAWHAVWARKGAGGVDGQTVEQFEAQAEKHLEHLEEELRTDAYVPKPVRRRWIEKAGSAEKRPLGIPTVKDRVVQTALRMVVEPIYEREFHPRSYGFRPGRGCKDALREVARLLEEGCTWIVDADIKSYFDTIPRAELMTEVRKRISDGRVLRLIESYLNQGVMDGLEEWTPEAGTPQGAVISPLLANIYLHPVDLVMAGAGYEMVRYADDLVILCRSEAQAQQALAELERELRGRKLTLHPGKTRIVDATVPGGFDFLGYHFEQGQRWPREKSKRKLKEKVREHTRRNSGVSLAVTIKKLNEVLRGWYEYFKHSRGWRFGRVDGWIRMRLRSILRKRRGGRGRGRGADHQRWNNAFFREQGLFDLQQAHALACQSLRRGQR